MTQFTVYFPRPVEMPDFLRERYGIETSRGRRRSFSQINGGHAASRDYVQHVIWGDRNGPDLTNLATQDTDGYDHFPNDEEMEVGDYTDLLKLSRDLGDAEDLHKNRILIGNRAIHDRVQKGVKIDDPYNQLARFLGVLNTFKGEKTYAARFNTTQGVGLVNAISVAEVLMRLNPGGIIWDRGCGGFSESFSMEQIARNERKPGGLWKLFSEDE